MAEAGRLIAMSENNEMTSSELIPVLQDEQRNWVYRAWAAMLLASMPEHEASAALSEAYRCDPVAWVRREALHSLTIVIEGLGHEVCSEHCAKVLGNLKSGSAALVLLSEA